MWSELKDDGIEEIHQLEEEIQNEPSDIELYKNKKFTWHEYISENKFKYFSLLRPVNDSTRM